jgi:hypothetical protein
MSDSKSQAITHINPKRRNPRRTRRPKFQQFSSVRAKDGSSWSTLSQSKPSSKLPMNINNVPYKVIQTVDYGTFLTTSSTATTFAAKYFTIGDVDQVSSFQTLFDQYRIDFIETWCTPYVGANNTLSEYSTVIDYDDATSLTAYSQALDYTNSVETNLALGQYRCFKPHIALAAYSGTFVSYDNATAPWIDFVSSTVQHYGLKIASQVTAVNSLAIHLVARIHFSCRNLR